MLNSPDVAIVAYTEKRTWRNCFILLCHWYRQSFCPKYK